MLFPDFPRPLNFQSRFLGYSEFSQGRIAVPQKYDYLCAIN